MATSKKPAKDTKKASRPDVDAPGKAAPSATSKPVIVSNRPLLKDPMVVAEDKGEAAKDEPASDNLAHTTGPKIQPIQEEAGAQPEEPAQTEQPKPSQDPKPAPLEPKTSPEPKKPAPEPEAPLAAEETEQAPEEASDEPPSRGKSDEPQPQQKTDAEAARRAQQAAEVQKLIASKKYELPINAVEKRKTKRFVALGILIAVLLVLVWADVALDAGLIKVNGVKPVTHFFSN